MRQTEGDQKQEIIANALAKQVKCQRNGYENTAIQVEPEQKEQKEINRTTLTSEMNYAI